MKFIPGTKDWQNTWKSTNVIHQINRTNNKNDIISIDAGEMFNKIKHQYLIKIFSKLVIEGSICNLRKGIYEKPTVKLYITIKYYTFFS